MNHWSEVQGLEYSVKRGAKKQPTGEGNRLIRSVLEGGQANKE